MSKKSISQIQQEVHGLAVDKGWYKDAKRDDHNGIAAKLCLIHSEVSECLEELRKPSSNPLVTYLGQNGKPEGFAIELADVVIRCLDLAGFLGLDLESAIERKQEYNKTRAYRHGNKTL